MAPRGRANMRQRIVREHPLEPRRNREKERARESSRGFRLHQINLIYIWLSEALYPEMRSNLSLSLSSISHFAHSLVTYIHVTSIQYSFFTAFSHSPLFLDVAPRVRERTFFFFFLLLVSSFSVARCRSCKLHTLMRRKERNNHSRLARVFLANSKSRHSETIGAPRQILCSSVAARTRARAERETTRKTRENDSTCEHAV